MSVCFSVAAGVSLSSVIAAARGDQQPKAQSTLVSPSVHSNESQLLSGRRLEILRLTEALLEAFDTNRFDLYSRFCDPTITTFEPETLGQNPYICMCICIYCFIQNQPVVLGQLLEGLDFHKFYFDNGSGMGYGNYSKCSSFVLRPHVHLMGEEGAVIAYTRLTQALTPEGQVVLPLVVPLNKVCKWMV